MWTGSALRPPNRTAINAPNHSGVAKNARTLVYGAKIAGTAKAIPSVMVFADGSSPARRR